MALLLGVLIIHGITPGPSFMAAQPDIFWGLVMSFWIGNLILLVLNITLIGLWTRVLKIPFHHLYPAILMFICIGVYSVAGRTFDVWMALLVGFLGYAMRMLAFPAVPLLLGFVLGPLVEEHFRRIMIVHRGDLLVFFERLLSLMLLLIALGLLVWGIYSALCQDRNKAAPGARLPNHVP